MQFDPDLLPSTIQCRVWTQTPKIKKHFSEGDKHLAIEAGTGWDRFCSILQMSLRAKEILQALMYSFACEALFSSLHCMVP